MVGMTLSLPSFLMMVSAVSSSWTFFKTWEGEREKYWKGVFGDNVFHFIFFEIVENFFEGIEEFENFSFAIGTGPARFGDFWLETSWFLLFFAVHEGIFFFLFICFLQLFDLLLLGFLQILLELLIVYLSEVGFPFLQKATSKNCSFDDFFCVSLT